MLKRDPVKRHDGLFHVKHAAPAYTSEMFLSDCPVSRETLERLEEFILILTDWQSRVNLVSHKSLNSVWRRHVLDSAQLYPLLKRPGLLVDLGSGAGFPGIVLSIMGRTNIMLIEASGKKCRFLNQVARTLGLDVEVIQERIEAYVPRQRAKYITARALAPLSVLLMFSEPLLSRGGQCLFLKGLSVDAELTMAKNNWNMDMKKHQSVSHPDGVVLEIGRIKKVYANT